MGFRPSRMLVAVGVACAGLAVGAPTAAQGQDTDAVSILGSMPTWASPTARVGELDGREIRHVHVALALRDPRGADDLVAAISTPGSPRYHQFLSSSEFVDRFTATPTTVRQISTWLRSRGLTVTGASTNRHFINATGSVATLQAAFGVRLARFRVATTAGLRVLAAPQSPILVPRSLRGAVQAVLGLDDTGQLRMPQHTNRPVTPLPAAPRAAGDPLSCALYWGEANNTAVPQKYPAGNQSNALCGYTTAQTRALYGLGAANTGAGMTTAIVGAYNLDTLVADTNRAAADLGSPPLGAGQYSAVLAPAFDHEAECGPESWHGEQALDVQAIHTIAPAARIVYYGAASCFTLFDTLNTAVADNRASVISNSWSVPGESLEPAATRAQMDGIALQAAIQGQTLLFITGDTGDNRGATGRVEPSWPASHPWVTAVGGTTVALDQTNRIRFASGWENTGNTQQGAAWVPQADADGAFAAGAGGGISTLYAQPDYQRGVVPDALAQGRRTVPDIAALADSYTGMRIGYTTSAAGFAEFASGGTSLAGPLVAGLVADAQQTQGVARMGFLNAALYALAGRPAITDIAPVRAGIWTPAMHTFGGVAVPTQPGSYLIDIDARPQSLQSAPGWDAVTGVGTPTNAFLTAIGR